ncbi:MAG: phenylacetate-CoA oxygenase subunit PaaJ [Chitinophagaceae bacterium]|nr:phenylacetate-CoA oxygenase subunit PaaJ [Chitinophagaceae bacterium]
MQKLEPGKFEKKFKESASLKKPPLEGLEEVIWKILEPVTDPEIPVLTIVDLGIIRDVKINGDEVEVIITPTYTGCPAMDMIAMNIKMALIENGYTKIKITSVLAPAWTTDWMSEDGKRKLKEYGIAPPHLRSEAPSDRLIACPQCHSTNTRLISEFGSTACKSLYQCNDCKEPFDYFKCH